MLLFLSGPEKTPLIRLVRKLQILICGKSCVSAFVHTSCRKKLCFAISSKSHRFTLTVIHDKIMAYSNPKFLNLCFPFQLSKITSCHTEKYETKKVFNFLWPCSIFPTGYTKWNLLFISLVMPYFLQYDGFIKMEQRRKRQWIGQTQKLMQYFLQLLIWEKMLLLDLLYA